MTIYFAEKQIPHSNLNKESAERVREGKAKESDKNKSGITLNSSRAKAA